MQKDFLKIVHEEQGIIYKVCKMYRDSLEDQEDLFQEIILQLWRAYPKFRNESKVSTWMYRIALNTAIATFRKKKLEVAFKESIPTEYHPDYIELLSENEERMFEADLLPIGLLPGICAIKSLSCTLAIGLMSLPSITEFLVANIRSALGCVGERVSLLFIIIIRSNIMRLEKQRGSFTCPLLQELIS